MLSAALHTPAAQASMHAVVQATQVCVFSMEPFVNDSSDGRRTERRSPAEEEWGRKVVGAAPTRLLFTNRLRGTGGRGERDPRIAKQADASLDAGGLDVEGEMKV